MNCSCFVNLVFINDVLEEFCSDSLISLDGIYQLNAENFILYNGNSIIMIWYIILQYVI